MTPDQVKLALRLYRTYKTDTRHYRELAERIGLTTAQLNARCWQILHGKK